MVVKIRIIPKKVSNKSSSASNFGQKSPWGHTSISPQSGARGLERWYGLNIKLYWNRKLHSLLGWMLPKIHNILKKASNKSFSALNFGQNSSQGHRSISPWSGARGLKRSYGWNNKFYRNRKIHSLFSTISSFKPPAPLQRGGR